MSFDYVLRWDGAEIYNLYMDLTYNNQVLLKNRSLFRYKQPSVKEIAQEMN